MSNLLNNWAADCNYEQMAHEKINAKLYSQLYASGWTIETVHDKERQKQGIDVILTSPDGLFHAYIDEKAREKNDTHTFGLELSNNYEWNNNKRTPGWFTDETKVTTHYMFYYREGRDEYAMLIDVRNLKEKIYSIVDRNSLLNPMWGDNMLSLAINNDIENAFIYESKKQQEHGRFLVLPLDFYRSICIKEWKL